MRDQKVNLEIEYLKGIISSLKQTIEEDRREYQRLLHEQSERHEEELAYERKEKEFYRDRLHLQLGLVEVQQQQQSSTGIPQSIRRTRHWSSLKRELEAQSRKKVKEV